MLKPNHHDPYLALRHPDYRRFLIGASLSNIGRQMTMVAVSWQIYQWTHSATALGMVGLLNVIPVLLISLPAGALADRYNRKWIVGATSAGMALLSSLLALVAVFHETIPSYPVLEVANRSLEHLARWIEHRPSASPLEFDRPALPVLYLIVFGLAILRVTGWSSRAAIVPLLVPSNALSNAITWNSSIFEIATITGPAIGGFVLAWMGFPLVYAIDAVCALLFAALIIRTHVPNPDNAVAHAKRTLRSLFAGVEFIWGRKRILAASSLDLFAVLLGGAVALLPIYADEILHVGPIGLGWLRAAPSIGAFGMALWLTHRRPLQTPGVALLFAVAGFGLATVVFGLSTWSWLSLLALVVTGACDNVSVVVRHSLVQLLTPDHLRGRVTAVNQIFIGSSNEIGTLRAGMMAAMIGPVGAVVVGGIATVGVAAVIAKLFPQLKVTPPLDQLKPA